MFEDVEALTAFARRCGGRRYSEGFRLFIGAVGTPQSLVLTGPEDVLALGGEVRAVDLDRLPAGVIRASEDAAALVGASPCPRGLPTEALVWCRDERAAQRIIRASLASGHDAIQHASVAASQGTAYLLRIAPPGWYALDFTLEEGLGTVFVPASMSGTVWTRWGTSYPLGDFASGGHGELLLFGEGDGPTRLAAPRWEDVYQLLAFELESVSATQTWTARTSDAARFTIPLRLVVTHKTRTPVMWLLRSDGRARLETLLGSMDEADLDQLQFAVQADPDGVEYILLRERHSGRGHQYIDFPAIALGPWHDYQNLFVPVDRNLEPHLRRDKYREVFALQPRHVTVAFPEGDTIRVVHLPESAFEPLTQFVDYVVGAGATRLRKIAADAVFEFGKHRLARRADAVATRVPEERRPAGPAQQGDTFLVQPVDAEAAGPAPKPIPQAAPQAAAPVLRTELEEREARLETEIITDGQTVGRWQDLAALKARLGQAAEADLCRVEAMWLGAQAEAVPATAGPFAKLWNQALTEPEPGELAGWVTLLRQQLDASSAALRKKERWLVWERLFAVSPDPVREARVREELLDELGEDGLRPQDVPSFIQRRTYETRFVTGDGSADELQAAQEILELVAASIDGATSPTMVLVGRAILAYGAQRLGDELRATDLRDGARRAFESAADLSQTDRAWLAVYVGAALELRGEGTGKEWLDRSSALRERATDAPLGAEELAKVAVTLLERGSAESPTAFLAAENFRALYPSEHKYAEAIAIQRSVEGHIRAGNFDLALSEVQEVAKTVATGERELELRQLAWLLGHLVRALTRIGRAGEGTQILSRFAHGVPEIRTVPMRARLYCVLARIKLGEGFLEFGDQARGMQLVCDAVRAAWDSDRPLVWLDHLDMLSAALAAVESAPMEARGAGVGSVLEALFLDRAHPQDTPDYRHIKLRLLDHCVEVGLSKERLSMKRYKRYLDEDEYHVRSRIVRRTP